MKLRARRGAFGMVVVELAPVAQPHVLLPIPQPEKTFWEAAQDALFGREDELKVVPRAGIRAFISMAGPRAALPKREHELTPDELRQKYEREAASADQPWGWVSYSGLFGGTVGRVYMSTTGPRWRCCGNRFEDEHSPWCSVEGFTDPFPEVS